MNEATRTHLTQTDQMSLAEERAAQTSDSEPDTLEVRDDSMVILEGAVSRLRRPVLIAVAAAGAVVVVALGVSLLLRMVKRESTREL